ncbi:MAG: ferrous iron transport protein A [Clostridia bacterium]
MTLSQMVIGQKATVTQTDISNKIICRLIDMGLSEKTCVTCLFKNLSREIIAYRIGDATVALRREDADLITVL